MPLWIKKNSTDWVPATKIWVKKNATDWVTATKVWIKKNATQWVIFWPQVGPTPEYEVDLFCDSVSYPTSGTAYPILTGKNYHWIYDTSLTLTYKFESASVATGPYTVIDSGAWTAGNPAEGASNTKTYTPLLSSDYPSNPTYFNFQISATDAVGTSASDSVSQYTVAVSVPAPSFTTNPVWSGTAASGYALVWNVGSATLASSTSNIGYQTTIYKSNNGGVTKTYLYGTATTPDYRYGPNYQYTFNLLAGDVGYTFYASTYAVVGKSTGAIINAAPTPTISASKTVSQPPGPFSITSATKGVYSAGTRPITVNWSTSQYATSYEFQIDSSSDGSTNWINHVSYGGAGAYPPTTSKIYNIGSNAAYIRVAMRSTNDSGLYAIASTVLATGQAPTAPVITSATSTTTNVVLTFTPPSSNGSSNDLAYEKAYKTTASGTWGAWQATATSNNTITFNDILTSGTSYDFKIRVKNFDLLYSPESNIYTISTATAPGPITNVVVKSFDSGYLTTFYTTGTNTTRMNLDYTWFQTQPPLGDSQNFDQTVVSSSSYYATNATALVYPAQPYNIALTAWNQYGLSTNYGYVQGVYPNGGDKPLAFAPTFSSISATGFTANFNMSGSTHAVIDLQTGGSSVAGYPKTITASLGANSYAIPETLSDSTTYTFYVTPRWVNPTGASFIYNGTQVSSSTATLYRFSMGKPLYVSTNGHTGLLSGNGGSAVPTNGYNILVHLADLIQYQVAGQTGAGLLYKWSNTTQYSIRQSLYSIGFPNQSLKRITYQINFYTDQQYYDIKYIFVGADVYSTTPASSAPGLYRNGSLFASGTTLPYPWLISTGATYRVYYNGSTPTAGIAFTELAVADMVDAGAVTNGNSDDGYTYILTTTNVSSPVLTPPTISSISVSNTSGPVSVSFTGGSGPFYQIYWWGSATAPTGIVTPDASGSSSPLTDSTGPSSTATQYMYIRSVATAGETTNTVPSTLASSWSAGVPFNMTTPPVIPTITMGSNTGITSSAGTINWTSTNQASFSSTGTFSGTGTTGTSISKTGLTASTNYTGTVTVTSSTGHTASANYSITTSAASVIPTVTIAANSGVSQTGGTINWTSTNQASYSVDGTFTASGNPDSTTRSVSKTGLTAGTTYTGTITVTSSTSNTATASYSLTTSPAQITVSWSANGGTGGGSTGPFNSGVAHTAPSPGTRNGYTFNGYYNTASADYTYGPIASGGSFTPPSGPTYNMIARWTANTPPAPGTPTLVFKRSTATVWWYSATWAASSGATSYELDCLGSSGGTATRGPYATNSTGGSSLGDFSLPQTNALWQVRARASNDGGVTWSGYSGYSNQA